MSGRRPLRASAQRDSTPAAGPVTKKEVHPDAWAAALQLAGGDASRLRVENALTVKVVN